MHGSLAVNLHLTQGGKALVPDDMARAIHSFPVLDQEVVGLRVFAGEPFRAPPANSTNSYCEDDKWGTLRKRVVPALRDGKHFVKAIYVGFGSLMHGPVFAHEYPQKNEEEKTPAKRPHASDNNEETPEPVIRKGSLDFFLYISYLNLPAASLSKRSIK